MGVQLKKKKKKRKKGSSSLGLSNQEHMSNKSVRGFGKARQRDK